MQGGQGWNSRQWGWACESVLGFDVVTADGELDRMPAAFTHTTYAFPIECFGELLSWAHEVLPTLDTRVEPVTGSGGMPLTMPISSRPLVR